MGWSFHRLGYHKFFEGYSEMTIPDGKGTHIERVYTAEYIRSELSDKQLTRRKVTYASLSLASTALWATVSLSSLPGILAAYVSIFCALAIFPMFFTLLSVAYFCTAPREMTINKHRESSANLKKTAIIAAIFLAAAGISELVFVILNWQEHLPQEFLGIAGYLLAAGGQTVIFALEQGTNYLRVENKNSDLAERDDASEINW